MGRGERVAGELAAQGVGVLHACAWAGVPPLCGSKIPGGKRGDRRCVKSAAESWAGGLPGAGRALRATRGELSAPDRAAGRRERRRSRQRGDACDRGRQPGPEGRSSEDLQPLRQCSPERAAEDDELGADGHRRRRVREDLRVLLGQVRHGRRAEGRRVLHSDLDRAPDCRHHRALPGPHLRSGLRHGRYVRPVRPASSKSIAGTPTRSSRSSVRSGSRTRYGWRR